MPRKKRFEYDLSNTTEDGHYIVGKGRPPESGQFKKGDGRQRGRRPKGTNNLATDLREELGARVKVTVGGKPDKVTRQRSIVMRLADNATKGQNAAIALILNYQQTLVDPALGSEKLSELEERDLADERLSTAEIQVMCFISHKMNDSEYNGDIVGVIPVYKERTYLGGKTLEDLQVGLKAYGIEITEKSTFFPPKCKLIS